MGDVVERSSILHVAGASNGKQARHGDLAFRAAAPETDFAPLNGAPERAFGGVVGRFYAFFVEEGKESFEMREQRRGQVTHVFIAAVDIAVGQSEELLLQRDGFQNQLLAGYRPIPGTRPGPESMPQAEQTRMQSEGVAAESFRLRGLGNLQYSQNVAFEVRPAKLSLSLVVFQITGTAVAAKDPLTTGKDSRPGLSADKVGLVLRSWSEPRRATEPVLRPRVTRQSYRTQSRARPEPIASVSRRWFDIRFRRC